jgi:glycosyltransferase involved in cell wall biosynthesis
MVGLGGEITALIVGGGDIEYIAYLKKLISENGLSEIIELKANIESHRVFLQHLSQAKLNVYPVVETMTSGTIIESMAVGTPIITYKSDVNARLNAKRASLREVDFDEIMIAKEALMLLSNNDMLEAISQAGLETYYELFNRSDNEVLESYI